MNEKGEGTWGQSTVELYLQRKSDFTRGDRKLDAGLTSRSMKIPILTDAARLRVDSMVDILVRNVKWPLTFVVPC